MNSAYSCRSAWLLLSAWTLSSHCTLQMTICNAVLLLYLIDNSWFVLELFEIRNYDISFLVCGVDWITHVSDAINAVAAIIVWNVDIINRISYLYIVHCAYRTLSIKYGSRFCLRELLRGKVLMADMLKQEYKLQFSEVSEVCTTSLYKV